MCWPSIGKRDHWLHLWVCLTVGVHGRGQKGDARSGSARDSPMSTEFLLAAESVSCRAWSAELESEKASRSLREPLTSVLTKLRAR